MSERKVFHDSVTELTDQPGLTPHGLMINEARAADRDETMTIQFALEIPDEARRAALEDAVASGKTVSYDELTNTYAADPSRLQDWLKKEGYDIVSVAEDGTSVFAKASVAKIEQSLKVSMVRVTKNGITYTAASNAPSLPLDVGRNVHAISGLQPFRRAHKHLRRHVPQSRNRIGPLEHHTATPNIDNAPPYIAEEILKAYGADNLPHQGEGQVIAILIDTFPNDADLQRFWKRNNLEISLDQIEKVNANDLPLPPPEGEETLDVQWTSGIAPKARIRIYASGSLQFSDLDRALDRIIEDAAKEPGLRQLSISLGLGETYMTKGELRAQHQKYLRLAALGVNVFVSSGDSGSNPDVSGHSSSGPVQTEYPASDTCVVSVGGTSLTLGSNGEVREETAWAGSGGGKSAFFRRPSWQKHAGIPAGKGRLVPDVSLVADPSTGALVVLHGQAQQIGGTSWSAPVWAAFCALFNEARSKAGKPPLPFLNTQIYAIKQAACFRDIASGSNGVFESGPGYDMVTGLGVPNVRELMNTLGQ